MNDCLITTETSRLLKSNSSTRFRAYENKIWEIPDAISNTVQQYHQLTKLANTFQTINLTIVIRTRFNGEENFARPLILRVLIKNWEIILISAPFCWKYLTLENLHRLIRFLSLAIIWKMISFPPFISRLNRWNFRTLREILKIRRASRIGWILVFQYNNYQQFGDNKYQIIWEISSFPTLFRGYIIVNLKER